MEKFIFGQLKDLKTTYIIYIFRSAQVLKCGRDYLDFQT